MGRLEFIGLGLGDERDLSPRARERLRRCQAIFSEMYTSMLSGGSLERLEKELERPIQRLSRETVEAESSVLEALDRSSPVAFLVVGDPFAATTHVALRLAAERAGHSWSYLPNASVLTAAPSFLGLQHYRFGRTVSVPFPAPNFAPRSPLEGIVQNRVQDLHTLVLLDLRPEENRFMTASEALRLLEERDRESPEPLLPPDLELAVVARVGTDTARAWFGSRIWLGAIDFGGPLHSLVVPARTLHSQEREALERVRVAEDLRGRDSLRPNGLGPSPEAR